MKTSREILDGSGKKFYMSLPEWMDKLSQEGAYEQQAQDFLAETNTEYSVRLLGLIKHFPEDKEERLQWEIKLERDGREYIFKYGASLVKTWEFVSSIGNGVDPYADRSSTERHAKYLLKQWDENDKGYKEPSSRIAKQRFKKISEELKDWTTGAHTHAPRAYDVLACLQSYEPPKTFDDFISEFGYEISSKESYENALSTFGKVVEEWTSLLTLYNNEEMEALSRIN